MEVLLIVDDVEWLLFVGFDVFIYVLYNVL